MSFDIRPLNDLRLVKAEWGASETNRRARYYTLTATGPKQLAVERQEFDRFILANHKVLNTA